MEAQFAALFSTYYGPRETVESTYGFTFLFSRVKDAAGIHFSSFKESDEGVNREDLSEDDLKRNKVLSNWQAPPHLMRKWTEGGEA